jgi:F-type H+-transporting ATPase subunit gamma
MAGAGIREIKRRIRTVKNLQQITRAMKMVAAAKLRKAQERVVAARPYAAKMREVIGSISQAAGGDHPLMQEREVTRTLVVVISAHRGLCGSYNTNLLRAAVQHVRSLTGEVVILPYGRRGQQFFARRAYAIHSMPPEVPEEMGIRESRKLGETLQKAFLSGEFDAVHLMYSRFVSPMVQRPEAQRLLPLVAPPAAIGQTATEYIMEPDAESLFKVLLPRFVDTQIFQAFLEANASEQGARMTSMSSATEKAGEMITSLSLTYNKVRQAGITKELLEIVGGAEALA